MARHVDRVLVATDDARIADAVAAFGGRRDDDARGPPERHRSYRRSGACPRQRRLINVQGDEPLLHPQMIDEVAGPLIADSGAVMSTLGQRLDPDVDSANPNVVKVVVDLAGRALYFSRAPVPYPRSGAVPARGVFRHVGIYGYRRDFLLTLAALPRTPLEQAESLEQLRALEHGYRITVVETTHTSVSVDTPEDLERVRRLVADGLLP